MSVDPEVVRLAASAYRSLYDFVQLRTHPLAAQLLDVEGLSPKEQGWHLHQLLLKAVEELYPPENARIDSPEWRRHRLMTLRYIDALSPDQTADKLSISRRQFYREHRVALEAVAESLWANRHAQSAPEQPENSELLRREVAYLKDRHGSTNIYEMLNGIVRLFDRLLKEKQVAIRLDIVCGDIFVKAGQELLRQVIVGLLGYWIQRLEYGEIHVSDLLENGMFRLRVSADPPPQFSQASFDEWILDNGKLLQLLGGEVAVLEGQQGIVGFKLALAAYAELEVLVVDDNEDMLQLYERYLKSNGYRVLASQTVSGALDILQHVRPACVILDLMMPNQDGWELLQNILDNSHTARIPTLVCSVLKQRELALALGATAFLEKPITEAVLLAALSEIQVTGDPDA